MRQWRQQMRRILMLLLVCLPVIAPVNSQAGNRSDIRATDCALVTGITQAECQALVDMYTGMDGTNWTTDTNWLVDNAPCAWFGITCSGGHVQKIDLRDNKLKGSLPLTLGNLTSLKELYLLDNEQINGNLPATISNLTQLQVLLVQNNRLSGSIPSSLSALPLVRLNLSINNFTGGIPIQLGNLNNIQILNLSDNILSSTIPTTLGGLDTLQRLYLSGNQLTGAIPTSLGDLENLIELDLTDNKLTGTIPASLNGLTNLIRFEVGKNLLSGTIPDLSNLTNLQWFYLNFNNFTGPLPAWIGGFTSLKWFYVNNNQFTGGIPPEFGNLEAIQDMNIGGNSLTGTIPDELGSLTTLKNFVVGSNELTGGFPATMIGINLTTLHIGYNLIDETDPAVVAYLDVEDIDWDETQTISPDDVSASVNDSNLTVTWTPILYTGDGGNYIVHCTDGATDLTVNTVDKTASEVVFSGLPAGNYTCSVQTFTPAHPNNFNDLLSGEVDDSVVNPPPANQPPNDLFLNPIVFDGYPRQNYSFNISNATTSTDPVPPENDPGCAVDLPENAAGVHYRIEGDAPGLEEVGDQGLVMHVGGPGWFSRAPAADTAIVVYELNPDGSAGAIVACADDNAPGEVSVSNAKFDLDTTKDYQVVVWNEGAAPEGAIIEMGLASFDLVSPPDSTIFTQPAEPGSFTWKAYGDEGTIYYFDIARTSDAQLPSVRLNELTASNDADGLICDATLCTLTIQAGSTLDGFLGNNGNPGNYIWSVAAKVPDPNNGNSTVVRDSNQIFRLVIAADGSVTPTPTEPAPTDTPTPTGTQPTSTSTPTGTLPTETPTPTATEDTGLDLLVNGGFEIDVEGDKIPDDWTLKNPSGDKVKCNKPDKTVAHNGECAFQFKGGVGEQSSLEQNLDGSAASVGDTVTVGLWLTTKNVISGAKLSVKIKYANADTGKLKITLPTGTEATYIELVDSSTVLVDTVNQFKLKIKNQSTGGKLILDDVSLAVEAASGLIPVPAAGLIGDK